MAFSNQLQQIAEVLLHEGHGLRPGNEARGGRFDGGVRWGLAMMKLLLMEEIPNNHLEWLKHVKTL